MLRPRGMNAEQLVLESVLEEFDENVLGELWSKVCGE